MKKSNIADRVADRIGVSRPVAKNAVDAVFEAMGETLANGEEVRITAEPSAAGAVRPAQGAIRRQERACR